MEGEKHFSHDHPLISLVDKEVDDCEFEKPNYLCNICGLPILSSPSYNCSITSCKFFLHKPCAQLPKELNHPSHDPKPLPKHTLHLKQKAPSSQNFTYICEECEFELHPLVAKPVEIKANHISHPSHPLVVLCRETLSKCDSCGEKQTGFFFCCQECDFWIDQDCILLPSIVRLPSHEHILILTYSLPSYIRYENECFICNRGLHLAYSGVYLCGQCELYVHVKCAKSSLEHLNTESARRELIQLPDEGDKFPSLAIRNYLHKNPLTQNHDEKEYNFHEHPLVFDNGVSSGSASGEAASCNLVCDVCIQHIDTRSNPFYKCLDCPFFAHDICVDHLCRVKNPHGLKAKIICPDSGNVIFNSVFTCFLCHRPTNGLCYYINDKLGPIFADPECLFLPFMIKHASHRQHVLFWARLGPSDIGSAPSCCPIESSTFDLYRCIVCDFFIHMRCALLPKRTRHKFDEHPLELIVTPHQNKLINEEKECCLCEFCEQDIDQQYWYYGCGECKQYFHINCIPSVGYLSKVKFGKTLVDDNIHRHQPLTLNRMLTHGRNERCGHCNKIIQGFKDEMAFCCSQCDFWICFSCARDSSTTPKLKIYSEAEEIMKEKEKRMAEYVIELESLLL